MKKLPYKKLYTTIFMSECSELLNSEEWTINT